MRDNWLQSTLKFLAPTVVAPKQPKGAAPTGGPTAVAGATNPNGLLPPAPVPKAPTGQQAINSFKTTATPVTSPIQQIDLGTANVDLAATYRQGQDTYTVIRNFARVNPDLSAALSAYLRVGIPQRYIALARGPDGTVNDQATALVWEILSRFDKLPAYDSGFSQTDSMRSVSEALAKEMILYGGAGVELVLDKGRLPYKLEPVTVTKMRFYEDSSGPSTGLSPKQLIGGTEIDLDIPTFFMVWLDPSLLEVFPQSPFESAIQPVIASTQFLNDLRRVCNRHVYPRYKVSIDAAKLSAQIPEDIKQDPDKLIEFQNALIAEIASNLNSMSPEDAFVTYDYVVLETIDAPQDVPEVFNVVDDLFKTKVATGAKVMPSLLGHGSGSQNVASTESMLFVLSADSMVRQKLQELYSRVFTLAARLFGFDVTVAFEFDPIDLRPSSELEAFKSMYFERITNQWSLGMIGDMEACLRLTGNPPPEGFKTLSGTFFKDVSLQDTIQNPYSGTSTGSGGGGSASDQARNTRTPKQPKGPAKTGVPK